MLARLLDAACGSDVACTRTFSIEIELQSSGCFLPPAPPPRPSNLPPSPTFLSIPSIVPPSSDCDADANSSLIPWLILVTFILVVLIFVCMTAGCISYYATSRFSYRHRRVTDTPPDWHHPHTHKHFADPMSPEYHHRHNEHDHYSTYDHRQIHTSQQPATTVDRSMPSRPAEPTVAGSGVQDGDVSSSSSALPSGWAMHATPEGVPYFHHAESGETCWEPPLSSSSVSGAPSQADGLRPDGQSEAVSVAGLTPSTSMDPSASADAVGQGGGEGGSGEGGSKQWALEPHSNHARKGGYVDELHPGLNQREAHHIFKGYDTDQSGSLDVHELKTALSALGLDTSTTEAIQVLAKYDVDRSGRLELEEFGRLVRELRAFNRDRTLLRESVPRTPHGALHDDHHRHHAADSLPSIAVAISPKTRRAFARYDADRSHGLDVHELKTALSVLGLDTSTTEAVQVLAKYDVDRSGRLELEEFGRLVRELRAFQVAEATLGALGEPSTSLPGSGGGRRLRRVSLRRHTSTEEFGLATNWDAHDGLYIAHAAQGSPAQLAVAGGELHIGDRIEFINGVAPVRGQPVGPLIPANSLTLNLDFIDNSRPPRVTSIAL